MIFQHFPHTTVEDVLYGQTTNSFLLTGIWTILLQFTKYSSCKYILIVPKNFSDDEANNENSEHIYIM